MTSQTAAWRAVVAAYQTCNQRHMRLMSHFDLTPSQFDVLLAIESLDEQAHPKELASGLLVSKSNITSVTRRLLTRDLIQQHSNPNDGRSIRFVLTKKGSSILKRAKIATKQFIELQLEPFDSQDVALVGKLMHRMRSHLESDEFDLSLTGLINDDLKRLGQ